MRMQQQQVDTGVLCPICKVGKITAEVEMRSNIPAAQMLDGPNRGLAYNPKVRLFYCSSCQVVFRHPPSKPNAVNEIESSIPAVRPSDES